jgi:hypothetical protein
MKKVDKDLHFGDREVKTYEQINFHESNFIS